MDIMKSPDKIVLFDGVCNLCNRSVQFILKKDKRKQFRFASLQGSFGQTVLKKYNLPADNFNSFLLLENEIIYTRSTAALRLFRHLGGGWQLFYVFIILPKLLRDSIYEWIARNRYKWFGKRSECMIPGPDVRNRFLD
jgi:predicted DCC family thiol-disulfide oxidoreductase YuxK